MRNNMAATATPSGFPTPTAPPSELGYARCENFQRFCNGNQVVPKKVYPKQDTRCVHHPYGTVYKERETWGWCEIEAHCLTNM